MFQRQLVQLLGKYFLLIQNLSRILLVEILTYNYKLKVELAIFLTKK